jgi:hypothetical protein
VADPAPAPPAEAPKPAAVVPEVKETAKEAQAAEPSELVFFMDPISGTAAKGKPIRVTIYASGGKGVTEATMEFRVDSKLKVLGINAGDFITTDGGSLSQTPGKDGNLTVKFVRKAGAADSGTLAVLDLEGVESGKATVLIQGGQYLVGTNPVSARVVNSMITVE